MINEQNSNLDKVDLKLGYINWYYIPYQDRERIENAALALDGRSEFIYEQFMNCWDVEGTAKSLDISEKEVIEVVETVHTNAGFNVYNY